MRVVLWRATDVFTDRSSAFAGSVRYRRVDDSCLLSHPLFDFVQMFALGGFGEEPLSGVALFAERR